VGHDTAAVVSIFEADDFAPFFELEMTWSEYFDMKFFPIVSAEHGLKFLKEAMAELEALVGQPASFPRVEGPSSTAPRSASGAHRAL